MLSTGGIALTRLESQILDLQKQNAILKQEMYTIASLTNIENQAARMGYVNSDKSTLVITDLRPLAIKP